LIISVLHTLLKSVDISKSGNCRATNPGSALVGGMGCYQQ
jgi:hypothetical protein